MRSNEKLGFGFIGFGTIGPWHAEAVKKIERSHPVAVATTKEETARKAGQKYNMDWYTDYRKLLERDDIDIVSVLTPSGMRKDIVLDAAKAGKHVLVEKPIEVTPERADDMIKACREAGVKLGVIFQSRFLDGPRKMKTALDEGRFGKLLLADAYIKWYRDQEYYDSGGWRGTWKYDGGGAMMNQSIHTIDLLGWMMGPVESVYAKTGTVAHKRIEVEDISVAILKFKNGAFGIIEGSTSLYPGFPARLEIHGENGTAILRGTAIKFWKLKGEREFTPQKEEGPEEAGASDPTKIGTKGHYLQIKDMVEAIREDREPQVNGEEGKKSVQLITKIYESARLGKEVKIT